MPAKSAPAKAKAKAAAKRGGGAAAAPALDLSSVVAVFTGFRDPMLEVQVINSGGRVVSAFSSSVTHVVAKDPSASTSKLDGARAKGIPVLGRDDFSALLSGGGAAPAATAQPGGAKKKAKASAVPEPAPEPAPSKAKGKAGAKAKATAKSKAKAKAKAAAPTAEAAERLAAAQAASAAAASAAATSKAAAAKSKAASAAAKTPASQLIFGSEPRELLVKERMARERCNGGELHAQLIWNDPADLDLHVNEPGGEELYFGHKECETGGWLDVDQNAGSWTLEPIENVFFASSPSGRYKIWVHNYNNRTVPNTTFTDPKRQVAFRVRLTRHGETEWFEGSVGPSGKVTAFEFDHQGSGAVGSFVTIPPHPRDETSTFRELCELANMPWRQNRNFYELVKRELVQSNKDMMLHDIANDTFVIGATECRRLCGKPQNENVHIVPKDVPQGFRLFVQSTSYNRKVPPGSHTLMKVSVREALQMRMGDQYSTFAN